MNYSALPAEAYFRSPGRARPDPEGPAAGTAGYKTTGLIAREASLRLVTEMATRSSSCEPPFSSWALKGMRWAEQALVRENSPQGALVGLEGHRPSDKAILERHLETLLERKKFPAAQLEFNSAQ